MSVRRGESGRASVNLTRLLPAPLSESSTCMKNLGRHVAIGGIASLPATEHNA